MRDLREGSITRKVTDDTHAGCPTERQMVYSAPFDGPQRERDYPRNWAAVRQSMENG